MQSRFVASGIAKNDEAVLLAYELNEDAFRLDLFLTPQKELSKEQREFIENNWVKGEDFPFPDATQKITPNLNAETILPDDIKSDETGKIRSKQNEWAYQLLTAKLWESYLHELEELKQKAAALLQYDRQLFDDAKSFWERVLEHRKERDISQERLEKIKDDVNSVFEKLKTFRKTESAEFEAASAKLRDESLSKIEDLKKRVDEKANFKALLEELKNLQAESRKNRHTKNDETTVRKAFDSLFHFINEQRNLFFSDKNSSRIKGLNEVIKKMEISLERDRKDLEYLQRKAGSSNVKALELQLNQLKTKMLNEAIASKEEKLKDIRKTLESIVKKTERKPVAVKEEKVAVAEDNSTAEDTSASQTE